jgi:DNA-binding NarL/FixJ family response regulator
MPETRVLALLVLDRGEGEVGPEDRSRATLFAHLLGAALAHTVLRARLAELATELKHLTASANALALEAQRAPIALSTDHGYGSVFPLLAARDPYGAAEDRLRELLTDREREVAHLLARGMTNPAIARDLYLSPDTVKAHVARVLRKLGASNRTEAAARVLELAA